MNNDSWQIPLIITSVCLFSFLVLGVILAIRTKSFQVGIRWILLFALVAGIFGISLWLITSIPDNILGSIALPVFFISTILIGVMGLAYWSNGRKGGKIVRQVKKANTNKSNSVVWAVLILTNILVLAINSFVIANHNNRSGIILLVILALLTLIRKFFSIFEIRENGFIARGKVILYSDIEHAEWKNLMDKTALRIRLKSTGKTISAKTPWDMIAPIDNYIKTNFPRP